MLTRHGTASARTSTCHSPSIGPWIHASPTDPPSVGAIEALVTKPTRSPSRSIDSPCHSTAVGAWTETRRRSGSTTLAQPLQRLAAHVVGRLPARHGEAEPDENGSSSGPMSWPQARKPRSSRAASKANEPAVSQPEIRAGRDDLVVQVGRELRRDHQLPAELARERHAERPARRTPDLDLAGPEERPRLGSQVFVGQPGEELA